MEFAAFVFFAVLIERLIEYFIKPRIGAQYVIFVALILAEVVSFGYKLDLIASLGVSTTEGLLGFALTGLVLAGGSNFLNDIVGAVRGQKEDAS